MSQFPATLRNPTLLDSRGLISGEWRHASNGKTFPVYNPANKAVLYKCANFSLGDFEEAIKSAKNSFIKFSEGTTAAERGKLLKRWFELVLQNKEDCKLFSIREF